MLERLSEIGMALSEEILTRTVGAPYHPEARHDAGRSFAAVSRAVRLTLAFEARIDAEILAMCNGKFATGETAGVGGAGAVFPASEPEASLPAPGFVLQEGFVFQDPPCPVRAKVRGAVCEAINREVGNTEVAREALAFVHERLIEGEDYDAYLSRPWRDGVEAICADLGLAPDWSQWSDEVEFAEIETGPRRDWSRLWSFDPARAREGRAAAERPPPDIAQPPGPQTPSNPPLSESQGGIKLPA